MYYSMTRRENGGKSASILNLHTRGRWVVCFKPRLYYSKQTALGTHWRRGDVPCKDVLEKRKFSEKIKSLSAQTQPNSIYYIELHVSTYLRSIRNKQTIMQNNPQSYIYTDFIPTCFNGHAIIFRAYKALQVPKASRSINIHTS
jgi:hypothetical protein